LAKADLSRQSRAAAEANRRRVRFPFSAFTDSSTVSFHQSQLRIRVTISDGDTFQ
jgi:hypothetical protein